MSAEKDLVRRAKRGDISAFEDLISGYEKKVYNTAYRFFNNAEDAMDVSQEIFIKIFTSLRRFREDSSFSTWLYRIAVNTCIDFLRKKREDVFPIKEEIAMDDKIKLGFQTELPEEFVEKQETKQAIMKAISTLPEEQRICIILRDVQGFSYTEISDILSCSLGTVKSRLFRGRRALKENLKDPELFFSK
ncbi:RNA polymerase, sigma-24 subunit, ECF subfamily [Tepidanaerobacter acetatoxydans Re1]|uniref:RNA polymerase, sigma-24 subunit, ECF subfamily n=1 Tax=Tepidanaerobacter acetatoxydans (strain DSM 21804 / JCM 16047 / Re1) TaxID=1209989 RepID=F4LWF5_TEPAE|nr:sigma-70 family RNA polymerase sigma factor [Tepidanaerobacter acetatoxydans]AEE91753.1 RNA polymerase, sigma-24 subunit, ECF subfamily [Tepidanaerobacter acetatoxydans Re1]CDI40796.1 RNA polymerase, sigma-24 subunit, ECF subfamily [Tepidanaerobacter acetatoxydans Re1]